MDTFALWDSYNASIQKEWKEADIKTRTKIIHIWKHPANQKMLIDAFVKKDNHDPLDDFDIVEFCQLNAPKYIEEVTCYLTCHQEHNNDAQKDR
jgi:hypothetical protein